MKYIWFHYMEFVHNKAVVLLMIVQFIFFHDLLATRLFGDEGLCVSEPKA